jgi:hypothetical protein
LHLSKNTNRVEPMEQYSLDRNGQERRGLRSARRLGKPAQEKYLDLQKRSFACQVGIIYVVSPAAMLHRNVRPLRCASA